MNFFSNFTVDYEQRRRMMINQRFHRRHGGAGGSLSAAAQAVLQTYGGTLFAPSTDTCFEDSAGSTPAVLDGLVGRIICSAGSALYATQTTTGNKPRLRKGTVTAGVSDGVGPWWLDFDEVDDIITVGSTSSSYDVSTVFTAYNGSVGVEIADMSDGWRITEDAVYGMAVVPGILTASEISTTAAYMATLSGYSAGAAATTNDIGTPGAAGFGVGICPSLPAGFSDLPYNTDPESDSYGNYRYSDGSIMVWVPAFYYRIAHASNPTYATYGANSVDVKPYSAFADVAAANVAGYALHRAFYDGGSIQPGFFVDKYKCSNNSGTASSIRNGNPLSTHATDHNPIGALTGTPASNYGGCFAASKTRGVAFFPATVFIRSALALLSLAHGQAATSRARCAWFDGTGSINYPKGCNNNALKDQNDATVVYQSDGYSNSGKTGSASNFAKSTHNGQDCGVADLNGGMWEIAPGVTCVGGGKTITGGTKANPVALTVTGHGLATDDTVMITGVGGMTQINDKLFKVTVVDVNTVTLQGADGTGFSAYTSGGTLTYGTFYALNTTAATKDLTGGNTLATDQWGATGVAAHSSAFAPTFRTDYAQNGFDKRYGKSTNQVLDAATSGSGWLRTGLGMPLATGISDGTSGSSLFGADHWYQYIRNDLCLILGADWSFWSASGAWASHWSHTRGYSGNNVGFRAASYL